ncbi:MAG: 16S rRNA (cytidine(1402)-2'-O)-methyltransferase [Firmicutes bacterium]|nr:16S rRNA (cytidine(1402)-2'-O)-methyltransferase [Bacillota bacterium]
MQRQLHYQNNIATLYLIPTPIGNLEDITFRAINIMKSVDVLYAEDTRVSSKLLCHYEINKPLKSYHEHNKRLQTEEIISALEMGQHIGLMSDAGMPLFNDPGYEIAQAAMEKGYNVVCLPGANAAITGLLMSGIQPTPFLFFGFLDSKKLKRIEELESLKYHEETLVFYETPHRIEEMIQDIYQVFGDRVVSIIREISKTFEEVIKGKVSELSLLQGLKGEMVVVVEGYVSKVEYDTNISLVEQVDYFIASGLSKTEAMKKVSQMTRIPKNKIYQDYLEKKLKK